MKNIIALILVLSICLLSGCAEKQKNTDINTNYLSADKYEMEIDFDNSKHTISGTAYITITNKTNTVLDELHIRNYTANITNSKFTNFKISGKKIKTHTDEKDKSIISVSLNKKLRPDKTIIISMDFKTKIPKRQDKFGYAVFKEKEIYNLSTCFPTLSFFDGEKWYDHPYIENFGESNLSHLSNYIVTVNTPDNFSVVATGDETVKGNSTKITGENLRELALVISNSFSSLSKVSNGTKINYYYLNFENNDEFSNAILEASCDSFELFSDYFGDYIHSELDIVHTFMESAMEYSGLVMCGYPDASDDDVKNLDKSSKEHGFLPSQQSRVAHEIAHQWFYSAVGNNPYLEPWLDEGFAEYCEDVLYHNLSLDTDGQKKFDLFMKDYIKQVAKDRLIVNKGYPDYTESDSYSKHVYDGGSMFLYELKEVLGEEEFERVLKEYYNTYKYKIAKTVNFLKIIKKYDTDNKTDSIIKKYIE
ncbi:MAG: M1 family metallopeptidase [Clostridia bacterium]|nr:M1 family metallopeptidase [Clostridia bacterium]